ncbi:hypothetical protein [Cylindrospermopsis raciborskii]|uniref:hypothetical protein n=1 Tax=Cylindrospermopsis raciborskii TaxID=77022 RepID=UPI003879B601
MAIPVVSTGQSMWNIAVSANCIRDNVTVSEMSSSIAVVKMMLIAVTLHCLVL